MTDSEKIVEKRKERIIKWLKDPYNLILLGVLIFSFILLLYYFNLTKNQTLWWDEAEYMSTAKHWALGVPYDINPQRPPLMPFLAALLYKMNFGEILIKFLIEIIPAWLAILFFYLLVKEMYKDKRIALIASFILSVSWIHLFYNMRFMTDSLGFLFGVLAFLCFWKGYVNNKGKIYVWLIGLFVSLSFMCRLTGALYGVLIILFLILTLQFNFLKNKNVWISFAISLITISPYLIWSFFYYGNAFAFRSGYGASTLNNPLGWWMLQLVYDYPEFVFFIAFLIGLITLIPMFLSLDRLILKKEKTHYNDFFILLSIIFTLGFFIYFFRLGENRWLISMSLGIFIISAKGIILIYDISKPKIGKILTILVVLGILFGGAYYQLNHADLIIKNKISTYVEVKEAGLWMKDHSNPSDIIVSPSRTQTTHYAERKVITQYNYEEEKYYTPEEFTEIMNKERPKYYVVSIFESYYPEWTYAYPENKSNFVPVNVWFADQAQKQPILVIYEVSYSD